jgi:hypothetical protein
MKTTTQSEKERLLGFEIMRLLQLSRDESVGDLLSAALAGREKNVASVTRLFQFVLRTFGTDVRGLTPSTVTRKFWEACSSFLKEAGLTPEELDNIHDPRPRPGDPDFKSILDEFREEGLL